MLIYSPFGSDLLTDAAKAALDGEEMGVDDITDFLAVSYSGPDYIGHGMGPNSVEVEDTYLRLDKNIEDLLNTLDSKVGAGKYVVFLTSDHGVAEIPQEMLTAKIPAGILKKSVMQAGLVDFLKTFSVTRRL